jgi:hypothetical protein
MPTDYPISPIEGLSPVSPSLPQRRQPQNEAHSTTPAATGSTVQNAAAETPLYTDPDITIDPATNLVVMAFRNAAGDIVSQFPTRQQLDAYRQGSANIPIAGD